MYLITNVSIIQNLHLTSYDDSLHSHENMNHTSSFCTDPLPRDPPPFQPPVTAGNHGLQSGPPGHGMKVPMQLVVVVLGECWWSQSTLLPSWTKLYTCSFLTQWLALPVVTSGLSKCDLSQLVLILVIFGLGILWVSQLNISIFILPWLYQGVIGFHQTICFWVKQITLKANSCLVVVVVVVYHSPSSSGLRDFMGQSWGGKERLCMLSTGASMEF